MGKLCRCPTRVVRCNTKLDQHKIRDELDHKRIQWMFNPPSSPWIGGCMEAMVKLTKRALKTIVKDRLFTEDALSTFLTEAESIINSRPLTLIVMILAI